MKNFYSLTLVGTKYPQVVLASVDSYLKERKIEKGQVPFDISVMAVAISIQEMIKEKSYFSVCTINKAANLLKIVISSQRLQYYDTLHCISWSEMTEQIRQDTIAMILDDFRIIFEQEDKNNRHLTNRY